MLEKPFYNSFLKKTITFSFIYTILFNLFPAVKISFFEDLSWKMSFYYFIQNIITMYLSIFIILLSTHMNRLVYYIFIFLLISSGVIGVNYFYLHNNFIMAKTVSSLYNLSSIFFVLYNLNFLLVFSSIIVGVFISLKYYKFSSNRSLIFEFFVLVAFILTVLNIVSPYNHIISITNPISFLHAILESFY